MSCLSAALDRLQQQRAPKITILSPASELPPFLRRMVRGFHFGMSPPSGQPRNDTTLQEFMRILGAPIASPEKVAPLKQFITKHNKWTRNASTLIRQQLELGIDSAEDYRVFSSLIILAVMENTAYRICGLYREIFHLVADDFLPDFMLLVIQAKLLQTNGGIELFNLSENTNPTGRFKDDPFLAACHQEAAWIKQYWCEHTTAIDANTPCDIEAVAVFIKWINEPHYSRYNREEQRKTSSDFNCYQDILSLQPESRKRLYSFIISVPETSDLQHPVLRDKQLWAKGITWSVLELTQLIKILTNRQQQYSLKLPTVIVPLLRQALKAGSEEAEGLFQALNGFEKKHTSPYDKRTTLPNLLKLYLHGGLTAAEQAPTLVATYDQLKSSGVTLSSPGGMQYGQLQSHRIVRNAFSLVGAHHDCGTIRLEQAGIDINLRYYFGKTTGELLLSGQNISRLLQQLNEVFVKMGVGYQLSLISRKNEIYQAPDGFWNFGSYQLILINAPTAKALVKNIDQAALVPFPKYGTPPAISLLNLKEAQRQQIYHKKEVDLANDPAFQVLAPAVKDIPQAEKWGKILGHLQNFPLEGKPNADWAGTTKRFFTELGADHFSTGLVTILDKIIPQTEWFYSDLKLRSLRGLTWACRLAGDSATIYALQKVATKAYRKVPGGPINAKLGKVALESLINIGTLPAYGSMNIMEAKATYSVFKRALASGKKKFKALLKQYSPEELEERSIPDYGFTEGTRKVPVGDYTALFQPAGLKISLSWLAATGKVQKTVPATLKAGHAATIKRLKAEAKNIGETFTAQALRLEASYLSQRSWAFESWQTLYAEHNLMKMLGGNLIWSSEANGQQQSFTVHQGALVDAYEEAVVIPKEAMVRLWHPATVPTEETLAWRDFLFRQQIQQPFKQAFREVYLLTPAEETTFDHSLRFANHYLRGKTLYSLGKTRGWTVGYQEPLCRYLPEADLTASFETDGEPLFDDVVSRALYFYAGKQNYGRDRVPLAEVPPIILSEIMRDLDLFIAVAGIVQDAPMAARLDDTRRTYWNDIATGKRSNAQQIDVRKDLISRLLPMTKLRKVAKIEGNFLHIQGKIKAYSINLGTGHCFIEPQNQYLCIVPARQRSAGNIWLPFASEDRTLTMILSKAFLLAADDKITDQTILMQLRRYYT